jgi:prepilin signal peptidase PulO-like enzyme (type II secretory pathway)
MMLQTLWWLSFLTAIGLCVGSFLNVVIYRLPRGQSLREPVWSWCPTCHHRIRWYDNLPIISFMRLRGRCRDCAHPISTRYLVVEVAMALVVLVLLDAFMIARVRGGLGVHLFGLTDVLVYDGPLLLAHVILFACLLSMSAIDLEHYWVDIRFTNLAALAGFGLHAFWTPQHSVDPVRESAIAWFRPGDAVAAACLAALVGLLVAWLWEMSRPLVDPEDYEMEEGPLGESSELVAAEGATAETMGTATAGAAAHRASGPEFGLADLTETHPAGSEPETAEGEPAADRKPVRFLGWLAVLVLVALFVTLAQAEGTRNPAALAEVDPWLPHWVRAIVPMAFLLLLILQQSSVQRSADHEIIEAIEEERVTARQMAGYEFLLLLPALGLAVLAWWAVRAHPDLAQRVANVLHWQLKVGFLPAMREWQPVYGLATAASGYVVAGLLGWSVRIIFTVVFGKEAFGTGDIHLMAAAGAVAGWPVVLLGFVLTCVLAMLGWMISLPFKRTRAIPLGPWLSLSFLAVVVFYDQLLATPFLSRTVTALKVMFG